MVGSDWVVIPGFPKYSVNTLGQVVHDRTGYQVRPQPNKDGDGVYVGMMQGRFQRKRSLAPLVASIFIPQPAEAFDTPINLNGDRYDCSVENLMWRPRWFAIQYHQQFTVGAVSRASRPIRDLATDEVLPDTFTAATLYGLLELDVINSIYARTYVWPTYKQFDFIE